MRMMKTLRAAMAALLMLALCAQGLPSASAASGSYDMVKGEDCSLTIEFTPNGEPMVNSTFRIWRVGTLNEKGYLPFEEIGGYHVLNGKGSWLDKASTLLSYLQRDDVPPTAAAATGEDGKVTFDVPAAEQGLYLVAGDSQYRGGTRYTPTPFLVMVPYSQDMENWELSVETYSKFTAYTPPGNPNQPETVRRHVLKSWEDEGYEDQRPEEIVVDLLRNGQVVDTVTLTAANSWRYDWTGLDARYEWTVVERENDQYTVLVRQEGITLHITNTWEEEFDPDEPPPLDEKPDDPGPGDPSDPPEPGTPTDPGDPSGPSGPGTPTDPEDPDDPPDTIDEPDTPLGPGLPQTGQLWWPVLPMALGGLVLIALGWKRRRDWSASDET